MWTGLKLMSIKSRGTNQIFPRMLNKDVAKATDKISLFSIVELLSLFLTVRVNVSFQGEYTSRSLL